MLADRQTKRRREKKKQPHRERRKKKMMRSHEHGLWQIRGGSNKRINTTRREQNKVDEPSKAEDSQKA